MTLRWRAEASKRPSNLILEFSLAMLKTMPETTNPKQNQNCGDRFDPIEATLFNQGTSALSRGL
jgi:hypothetical protein